MRNRSCGRRAGFTLIEVLIVVVILGILASTVLPQLATSSADAKQSALQEDMDQLRRQIQLYRFEHDGNLPSGTATNVANQLLMATDINGNTAVPGTAGFTYGPYLSGQFPPNPYNGGNGILVVTGSVGAANVNPTATQGTALVGWIFSSVTGQIIANTSGTTSSGVPISSL